MAREGSAPLPATLTEAGAIGDPKPPVNIGGTAFDYGGLVTQILTGYFTEADMARKGGLNPRDTKWNENLDLYWNRFDFSKKAPWQSRAVLPEVPKFVDRFAAAMTEALNSGDFFTVTTPGDHERDLSNAIKRMMEVWLGCVAISPDGHKISFTAVFNELMKLGAIMNLSAVVTWRESPRYGGYVSIEAEDPRRVWLDHTRRGLYRIRASEVDHHQLMRLARQTDSAGNPIYDLDAIEQLTASIISEMEGDEQRRTGSGTSITSNRKPIILHEYLCTLIAPDGKVLGENQLCVVANEKYLIRGPEKNPFWHQTDWVLSTPIVPVPLSPYGRSYMENFGSLARLFNDLTNLLMDATFTSSMKAFALVPSMLEDPTQADDGIYPNVTFRLEDGRATDFFKEIDLGQLPPEALAIWKSLKDELQDAASFNEIGMGQLAPNSRTSASEVVTAEQNSSAMVRDLARNVETRFLEPLLDLVWRTGLQHMSADDPALMAAAGSESMFAMIFAKRKELAEMPTMFEVRGISTMVARGQKLRALLQMLQLVASNPDLLAAFKQRVDVGRLLDKIFALSEIDIDDLKLSPREAMMQQLAAPPQPGPGATGAPGVAGTPAETQAANVQNTIG